MTFLCYARWSSVVLFFSNVPETRSKPLTFQLNLRSQNLAHRLLPHHHERMSAEIYASESYQNLLFSILHFHTLTFNYPTHITLISHAFKRARFLQLHCRAIRWPLTKFAYIGIDPPEDVTPRSVLEQEEKEKGYGVWEGDLYGAGSVIGGVRERRGWECGALEVVGKSKDHSVEGLLKWRGGADGKEVYEGRLPWDG